MAWHALLCSPPLNFLNGAEKVIWLILLGNANRKDKSKRLEDLHALLHASPTASHLWHPWKEPSDCSPLKHSWCASGMRFLQPVHPTQSIAPSKGCCFSRGNLGWGGCHASRDPLPEDPSSLKQQHKHAASKDEPGNSLFLGAFGQHHAARLFILAGLC